MNDTLETIHALRTIHGDFTDSGIPEEHVETILNAATRAANASGRQSYSIVVVEDRAKMKQLCGFQGSLLMLFCVDFNRIIDVAQHMGLGFEVDPIVSFVTGSTDTILASQTVAIAAKSLGIDSLFTNGIHRGDIDRVYAMLSLPHRHCFPLVALVLGYPRKEPTVQKGRLNGAGVMHKHKYQRLSPDQIDCVIAQYDDPEKHLGLNDNWGKQSFAHYLEWFYKVWSRRAGSAQGPGQMSDILQRAGFKTEENG